jgi:hypothetical protein
MLRTTYNLACSRNHCCRVTTISITYSECVFLALVIQHVKCMGRIILSSVAWPAVQYFPTLSHNRDDFRGGGGITEHKMCCNFLYNFFSEKFIISRRIQRHIIINVQRSSSKVPVINETWNVSRLSESTQKSKFMSVCSVAAELFHADGQTFRSLFSQFCESA